MKHGVATADTILVPVVRQERGGVHSKAPSLKSGEARRPSGPTGSETVDRRLRWVLPLRPTPSAGVGREPFRDRRVEPSAKEDVPLGEFSAAVTTLKRAKRVLGHSEEFLRLFIESVQDYAIFLLDTEGVVLTWGPGAEQLKGYRAEEIVGKHFAVFYNRADIKQGKPEMLLQDAAAKGRVEDEGWRLRKDGSRFWANVSITSLRDGVGHLQGFGTVVRDETARKRTERVLRNHNEKLDQRVQERNSQLAQANRELQDSLDQLHALAARLQAVREEERTSIAREIHDELGQALTALKIDLVWLMQRLPYSEDAQRDKASIMLKLIDGTIFAVRRIAAQLRPGILDDLGLAAAIEWQSQEFEARTGVECQVLLPAEGFVLDDAYSTAIFRIFQETLTNVARHADATRVTVKMERTPQELVMEVQDNGKGFDAAVSLTKSQGILGMKERALILGGALEVRGSPGKGTAVTVRVPWSNRGPRRERMGTPRRRKSDFLNPLGPADSEGDFKS
jgi:PAS domain S-box-containing protein